MAQARLQLRNPDFVIQGYSWGFPVCLLTFCSEPFFPSLVSPALRIAVCQWAASEMALVQPSIDGTPPFTLVFSLLFGSFCPLLEKPRPWASALVHSCFSLLPFFLSFPFSPRTKGRRGMWVPGKFWGDCQPLVRDSLPAEAGSFGVPVRAPRLTFSTFLHPLLLEEFCPSATPMRSSAVLCLSPLPVSPVPLLHDLSRNRSDLCKTSPNALESDLPPALPFHKAHFHQHCIWSFSLTFRWCSVNSWLGLLDLPAVADSLNQWARESLPLLSCRADPSSRGFPLASSLFSLQPKEFCQGDLHLGFWEWSSRDLQTSIGICCSWECECPQHFCLSSAFWCLSLCAVPKLIKVIQVPSTLEHILQIFAFGVTLTWARTHFHDQANLLSICLSSEMPFVELGILAAWRSCLALNPFFPCFAPRKLQRFNPTAWKLRPSF